MSKEEKLLLLQLILQDIRGNWGDNLYARVRRAKQLAEELHLDVFIDSIDEYNKDCSDGYNDGRYFRKSYTRGGYEELEELHGLQPTMKDKSAEFQSELYILTYPENRLTDWK